MPKVNNRLTGEYSPNLVTLFAALAPTSAVLFRSIELMTNL
jgi:hypothetical protein